MRDGTIIQHQQILESKVAHDQGIILDALAVMELRIRAYEKVIYRSRWALLAAILFPYKLKALVDKEHNQAVKAMREKQRRDAMSSTIRKPVIPVLVKP